MTNELSAPFKRPVRKYEKGMIVVGCEIWGQPGT